MTPVALEVMQVFYGSQAHVHVFSLFQGCWHKRGSGTTVSSLPYPQHSQWDPSSRLHPGTYSCAWMCMKWRRYSQLAPCLYKCSSAPRAAGNNPFFLSAQPIPWAHSAQRRATVRSVTPKLRWLLWNGACYGPLRYIHVQILSFMIEPQNKPRSKSQWCYTKASGSGSFEGLGTHSVTWGGGCLFMVMQTYLSRQSHWNLGCLTGLLPFPYWAPSPLFSRRAVANVVLSPYKMNGLWWVDGVINTNPWLSSIVRVGFFFFFENRN